MKMIINRPLVLVLLSLLLPTINLQAEVPHYRGKVVLVVDHTMATNPAVNLTRLQNDLVGDGWRVLQLEVDRGPELPPLGTSRPPYQMVNGFASWENNNAHRIREVRALIKADYDSAPNEVKNVFLIGHVPTPYSGSHDYANVGGHYQGAKPADSFYGDMIGAYAAPGWSDINTAPATYRLDLSTGLPYYYTTADEANGIIPAGFHVGDLDTIPNTTDVLQCDNYPQDGKFDQDVMPFPMKLGVGRIDFFRMSEFGVDETTLITRYLNKNHDFRWGNFQAQRRALFAGQLRGYQAGVETIFNDVSSFYQDSWDGHTWLWFPNVKDSGEDYLLGYAGGVYSGLCQGVGTSASTPPNDFLSSDSRVVFVTLYGSFMNNWESSVDFLKAPLANPYDPANGRYGYGLTSTWFFGLDAASLNKRALGATIGEALFNNYTNGVNYALMGDPTLRLYTVLPPTALTISNASTTVYLNWSASADTNILGYNVYSAPTDNGPYSLRNTTGPVTNSTYTLTRTTSGVPDNFYMVRAAKWEETPVGSYTNMSEGVVTSNTDSIAYLSIISEPASSGVVVDTDGYTNNAAAFTVDAVGITTNGNETLTYQWYKDGTALTDNGHIHGATTRALLIINVQTNDMASYTVVVGLADGSASTTSTGGGLTVAPSNPTAVANSFTITRHVTTDLDVLANDTSTLTSPTKSVISVSALSNTNAGTLTINSGGASVHFVPSEHYLGTVTFTYVMTDGCGQAQATVTVNVAPHSGNTPPAVSVITDQTMMENTILEVPFTISDDYSSGDDLAYIVTSSNPGIIPNYNLSTFGTGSSRMLQIIGGANRTGTIAITLQVNDEDLGTTTESFDVTILPDPNLPQLSDPDISSNTFSFWVAGPVNSYWNVYASQDLTNWTQIGGITLNGFGTNIFTDNTISGVSNRVYKVSDGNHCSAAIGFERIIAHPGQSLIANQFDVFTNNALNTVFYFTTVPNLAVVQKWNGSGYDYYTNVSGVWLPSGTATVSPGEGFFFDNPSTNDCLVIFVGLVHEGSWSLALPVGYSFASSIIPIAGGVKSVLGYQPEVGDGILKWDGTEYVTYTYLGDAVPTGWIGPDDVSPEPVINIGEGFSILNSSSSQENWTGSYSACGGIENCTVPMPTNCSVCTNTFTFEVIGAPNTYWNIYASTDLTNWSQVGGITLSTVGTNFFTDTTIAGVTNRVYKLSNGSCCSQAIGFQRILAKPGFSLIANQFDMPPDNTLNSVFTFTAVPNGSVVQKLNGAGYDYYTNASGVWLPTGTTTLAPGEGAFFNNPTSNNVVITFAGLVREGSWNISLPAGQYSFVSSVIPIAGGVQSALGYHPEVGDTVQKWNRTDYDNYVYLGDASPTGWIGPDGPAPEPVINIGEGFSILNSSPAQENWTGSYFTCGGIDHCTVPTFTNCAVATNTFTFEVIGVANSYWNVYISEDLTHWTQVGSITLNGLGTNFFTDTTITGVTNRVYKLGNGNCCSQAIGFERIITHPGYNLIANQFDVAPDNTLNTVFHFTAVPNLTVIQKWNGTDYDYYTNVSSVWLPTGTVSAAPGEGFFFDNPASNNVVVTFAGLVRESSWSIHLPEAYSDVSSIIPIGGGVQSGLGYQPEIGDTIYKWNGTDYLSYTYIGDVAPDTIPTGWIGPDGESAAPEPIINVGEGFFISNNSSADEYWTGSYSSCH